MQAFTRIDQSDYTGMENKKSIHLSTFLIVFACSLFFFTPSSQSQDVFVSVGNGSGAPGSQNNSVTLSMQNNIMVKGLQLAIKDDKNFLFATGCNTIGRASVSTCEVNEHRYGWTILELYSFGGAMIGEGSGPILTINYRVKDNAPLDECFSLGILKKALKCF